MSKHTDSVEAIMKEFERRMPLITSHGLLLEARLTPTNYQKMKDWLQEKLTTLQATHSQQVEEAVRKMFNLNEITKEWQEHFYESDWHPDTLEKTQLEKDIEKELGTFLPRHMDVYDWNLPYIDFITLVVRKHIKKAQTPNHQD